VIDYFTTDIDINDLLGELITMGNALFVYF